MAGVFGKTVFRILKIPATNVVLKANYSVKNVVESFKKLAKGKKVIGITGAISASALGIGGALYTKVVAGELELHPPNFPWAHKPDWSMNSIDHESARRGYQVYKQVCAACHSMNYLYYRQLIGTIMTEEEAKAEAAEITVVDGPDLEGNMYERPGRLSDKFPNPYANDEAAKFANNGAMPPDLTFIVNARHGGEDYLFSLLTGYCDPPESIGVSMQEGTHYNPYFLGGAISMAQAIYDEMIEYEDGTPATASQLAKDVCVFLRWVASPDHDQRKRIFLKFIIAWLPLWFSTHYMYKHVWSMKKSMKIAIKPK